MKKIASVLFCCLFFGICVFCAADIVPLVFASEGEDDRPRLFTEEGINHAFGNDCEEWVSENFTLRDRIVDFFAEAKMTLFSEGSNQVIVGKDEFLFFGDTAADYIGSSPMTDEEITEAAEALLTMAELSEANGARFLFVAAPNKNTVYGDKMPSRYIKSDMPFDLDRLYRELDRLGVPYLDLRPVLLEAAETELVYHKRDTHWNGVGAKLAFEELAEYFGVALPDLTERGPITDTAFEGDLDALLFPGKTMYDTDITYDFEGLFLFTTAYSTPMDLVITARSGGEGTLLMFRDSFANAWIPYAASTFREIRLERATPYRTEYLASMKPDYVVVEIAERNLRTLADAVNENE